MSLTSASSPISGEDALAPDVGSHEDVAAVAAIPVDRSGPLPVRGVRAGRPYSARSLAVLPNTARALWADRALWLGACALALVSIGEALTFSEEQRLFGVALIVAAMAVGAIAWNGRRDSPLLARTQDIPGRAWLLINRRPVLAWRFAGITGSAALAVGSIRAYLNDPDAIFGLQGALWLASMALLLASCARWYPTPAGSDGGEATGVDAYSVLRESPSTSRVSRALAHLWAIIRHRALPTDWSRGEVILFAGLVLLSLVTHVAMLQEIPWRFHFDEGFAYTELMRYYRGPAIPMFTTTWANTSLPSLWFAVAAQLMHITGPTLLGTRLGVALVGALTVVPVYGIARLAWGRLAAALAGFGVAVSAAYVHYSRVSIINITTAFWWALTFYFLLKGMKSRRPGDFVWAGLAAGTSMYTYYGTRLLPYVLLAYVAYLLVFHFRAFRERIGHFALMALGFLAGFGPLIGYFILNPTMWAQRGLEQLNVQAAIPTTWDGWAKDWNVLSPLLVKNFLGLSVERGHDTVYYAPLLLAPEAALLFLGVGVLIWRWRQPASFLVLLWGASVFVTSVLLDSTTIPNFAHWAPAFPTFYLAMALPLSLFIGWLWSSGLRPWKRAGILKSAIRSPKSKIAGAVLLAALLAWDLGANAYAYLVQYPPKVPPDFSLETVQGRFLESLGPSARARVVGATWQPLKPDIAAMMAPSVVASNFYNPSRELPVVGDQEHDLAFLFYNDELLYLPLVQRYYPGGRAADVRTPDNNLIGESYVVPAMTAWERYGAAAVFSTDAAETHVVWKGQVPEVGYIPGSNTLTFPLVATYTGWLYVPQPGPVRLYAEGGASAQINLMGQAVSQQLPETLEPGWVPYRVQATLKEYSPFQLYMQDGSSPDAAVDTSHLWPGNPGEGLAITFGGLPDVQRVDQFVGAGYAYAPGGVNDPDALPLAPAASFSGLARWEGEVLTESGLYQMTLRSDAHAQLVIDGVPASGVCPSSPMQGALLGSTSIQMSAGWHKVQINYQAMPGAKDGLEWFWTRPDGVQEVVPPSALRISEAVANGGPIVWPGAPQPINCGQ